MNDLRRKRLAALTSSALIAFGRQALACDPDVPSAFYTSPNAGDTTPPTLSEARISVQRADNPGEDNADCSGHGRFTITFEASDDQTPQTDLGLSVKLVEGSFPLQLPPRDVQGREPGKVSNSSLDDGEAFDATLEVQVVDRAGNRSEPKLISTSGDAVGCSCSAAGGPAKNYGALLPLFAAVLLVRRRRSAVAR